MQANTIKELATLCEMLNIKTFKHLSEFKQTTGATNNAELLKALRRKAFNNMED